MRLNRSDFSTEELQRHFSNLNTGHRSARYVHIGEQKVSFLSFSEGRLIHSENLPIGVQILIDRFIKNDIPTEAEIEYTITEIEDQLMARPVLKNKDQHLVINDELIASAFNLPKGKHQSFSKQEIESVFTEYAMLSMGRSPVLSQVEMDQQYYVGILILREILHHLYFDSVWVM